MEKDFGFEQGLKRLEEIADTLEKGEVSLEEMTALYSEGAEISAKCAKLLEEARIKITELSKEAQDE